MNSAIQSQSLGAAHYELRDLGSGLLSAVATLSIMLSGVFVDYLTTSRLLPLLVLFLLIHCLLCPRLFFPRESALYLAFVGYMIFILLWTPDRVLALNTLFPAVDFVLIALLFGSLFAYHQPRAVALGALIGFWVGAAAYTYAEGFPFRYPDGFSYNAVASMYLCGLVLALLFGWLSGARRLTLVSALFALVHIVATTSIKTNLGVLLGAVVAMVIYHRESMRLVRKNVFYLLLVLAVTTYALVRTEDLSRVMVKGGFDRIAVGLNVLQARQDKTAYVGFEEREYWMHEGLQGWTLNPMFGHGVEAFRAEYGTTSHSTPVDLLYNMGLVGFSLFYALFALLLWRLFRARRMPDRTLHALILGTVVCYVFVSLSGTMFYHPYLAIFVAAAAALLHRCDVGGRPVASNASRETSRSNN
jgi:O-antigen ligase